MVKAAPLVCLSLTPSELQRLVEAGPRRDIVLMSDRAEGELLFRRSSARRKGLRAKLFGPHLRQAWEAAAHPSRSGRVFADGEHLGYPLAAFLALRGRRSTRVVILGHLVDKPWKRRLLWLASRLAPHGTLILHSTRQRDRVRRVLPTSWDVVVVPYQVDAEFWRRTAPYPVRANRPLVISAGSENRDYQPLIEAARGMDIDVVIAAGSHWARSVAKAAAGLPPNVRFLTETLSFSELRDLYERATAVVIPLFPGSNQAGVTTLLEAMSMELPIVISATEGQREVATGPVVTVFGDDRASTADRGPQLLGLGNAARESALYVPPGDAMAIRRALETILRDPERARQIGQSARAEVTRCFTVEQFAERFSALLTDPAHGPRVPSEAVTA